MSSYSSGVKRDMVSGPISIPKDGFEMRDWGHGIGMEKDKSNHEMTRGCSFNNIGM